MYDYNKYIYNGPVMLFNACVVNRWKGETMAPSERKARSNLIYQFKKQNKISAGAKYSLPGKLEVVNERKKIDA